MKKHGNSLENQELHHLYEIRDRQRKGVFKYGICGQSLNADGTSPRANTQVRLFNRLAGWSRFFANILIRDIPGRKKAEELENQYIAQHEKEFGKKPPGNP
jgi:hypothetical protein